MQTVLWRKENSQEEVTVDIPVLLPHKVLSYLFDRVGLEVCEQQLAAYWRHVKAFCPWANNDLLDGEHIPLTLYGDSARYGQGFDQSKVTGCYLSMVLWRPRSTRMSQWLLWSLNAELSLGWRSHYPLYLALVKSLNAAFDGLTPEGRKLGRKFCVTQFKGDWEYHWQTWRLSRYWRTRLVCWRCDAENHDSARHSMLDFSDRPAWLGTQISHNRFVAELLPHSGICVLAAWYSSWPQVGFPNVNPDKHKLFGVPLESLESISFFGVPLGELSRLLPDQF